MTDYEISQVNEYVETFELSPWSQQKIPMLTNESWRRRYHVLYEEDSIVYESTKAHKPDPIPRHTIMGKKLSFFQFNKVNNYYLGIVYLSTRI